MNSNTGNMLLPAIQSLRTSYRVGKKLPLFVETVGLVFILG